ncbi:MAG: putative phage abortive infection protein [Algoriphagus sp.]|uniref:putative phage abortive infection protein n=1 Tax=Algoriphagus sp. TaxID=1872435 RepID=UPI002735CEA1|nr:putative phage abortive infection protein [Algoriphagus sp.]MDP3201316.1 putative phage abortive infection protein [Algoriphagus sp.]
MEKIKVKYKKHKLEFWILLIGILAMNVIFLSPAFHKGSIARDSAGHLGDFVGGYVGTLFALISVLILARTLKSQKDSNDLQKFETRFFELLRFQRENVDEMELAKRKGRRIFVLMIREFREVMKIVKSTAKETNQIFEPKDLISISYYGFYYGGGPHSKRMLRSSLSKYEQIFVDHLIEKLSSEIHQKSAKKERSLKYRPFGGHLSRLGHYYRHLYQTVKYVHNLKIDIDKKEYIRTLRAQLTVHEQAMFFLNSLNPMGKVWWDENFIKEYGLVKNIPKGFFDEIEEINITSLFPSNYFEWQGIENKN